MKSKTKINKQIQKKTSSKIVETINLAKKNKDWYGVAQILSGPRKNQINLNLSEIDENSKEKDIIVVPGKVLSQGELEKKIKVVALGFSEKAKEKLLKAKCEINSIKEEIKKNSGAKGIKILTKK